MGLLIIIGLALKKRWGLISWNVERKVQWSQTSFSIVGTQPYSAYRNVYLAFYYVVYLHKTIELDITLKISYRPNDATFLWYTLVPWKQVFFNRTMLGTLHRKQWTVWKPQTVQRQGSAIKGNKLPFWVYWRLQNLYPGERKKVYQMKNVWSVCRAIKAKTSCSYSREILL